MRLLSLNAESGASGKVFQKYITSKSKTVDIFCFQEVYDSKKHKIVSMGERTDFYKYLKILLKGYKYVFFPVSDTLADFYKTEFKIVLGLAIFYKEGIKIKKHFGKYVYGSLHAPVDYFKGKESNAVQCLKIISSNGSFWLCNFHGASRPGNKLDTPRRIQQSKTLLGVLDRLDGPKILCGDFNLMPNTESIKMFERSGMRNLIKTYKIKNTRNSISWARYNNRQSYADYAFVSKEIKVKDFKVPYTLASDHLPMILDFQILI